MKKKILVADDDPGIVDAIQIMLEDENYEVETSVDGQTLEAVKRSKPNLVLLDVWMSGEDGREICKKLKGNVKTKNVPIIMISATQDLAESSRKAGADDFIAKPFQMKELLSKIKLHLEKN